MGWLPIHVLLDEGIGLNFQHVVYLRLLTRAPLFFPVVAQLMRFLHLVWWYWWNGIDTPGDVYAYMDFCVACHVIC